MKIPTFVKTKAVDQEGYLSDELNNHFDVLNVQMQDNLSDDGFVIPARKTIEINHIADGSTENSKPDGTMWYDNETHQAKMKINGVVKIFNMT